MKRPMVATAESLIGVKHPVLEHGYVVLVDYMGDDAAIVQAARVSYGLGTKSSRDDRGLIRYLMRHQHTTPFEMVEFKFLIRLPIYVARQFVRHRMASINEYSARYSIIPDEFDIPRPEAIRPQSGSNRQGRSDETLPADVVKRFRTDLRRIDEEAYALYERSLKDGITRELARIAIPTGIYTEWYWKMDLHNLFHFLELRLDPHAQEEIRLYAEAMAKIVQATVPVAYEAFEDFALGSERFSRKESAALAEMLSGQSREAALKSAGLPTLREDGKPMKTGEGVEFLEKLGRLDRQRASPRPRTTPQPDSTSKTA